MNQILTLTSDCEALSIVGLVLPLGHKPLVLVVVNLVRIVIMLGLAIGSHHIDVENFI